MDCDNDSDNACYGICCWADSVTFEGGIELMKNKTRKLIKLGSHLICFGLAVDLFYLFLCAYFNDFSVMIRVNHYGEAYIELIVIPITLLFCLVGLVFAWRDGKE